MLTALVVLLIVYQVKHLLADYFLQGEYMLGKFKPGWAFLGPLLAHVGVHAGFTWLIATAALDHFGFSPDKAMALGALVGLFDATVHFFMDRIKAGPKYMGRWQALSKKEMLVILSYKDTLGLDHFKKELQGNKFFWWSLGFDQFVHHLTHYACIFLILKIAGQW